MSSKYNYDDQIKDGEIGGHEARGGHMKQCIWLYRRNSVIMKFVKTSYVT